MVVVANGKGGMMEIFLVVVSLMKGRMKGVEKGVG